MALKKEIFRQQTAPKVFSFGGSRSDDLHLSQNQAKMIEKFAKNRKNGCRTGSEKIVGMPSDNLVGGLLNDSTATCEQ